MSLTSKQITKNCLFWNEELLRYKCQNQRYCGISCSVKDRDRGIHKSIIKKCLECNKEFKVYPSVKKIFCSPKCTSIYYGRKHRQENNGLMQYKTIERISENGDRVLVNRYLMEKKLNRKLLPVEIVHHIDMNRDNNTEDCSNYYLYGSRREHNLGHNSLLKLVPRLLNASVIDFKDGKYILLGEVRTKEGK